MMYKGTTNYKLLGAYVAKIIGYSAIDFFFRKIVKKKNDCRGALFAEENFSFPPPPPPEK